MLRVVRISDKTRSQEFDSMFVYGPNGKITLNTNEQFGQNSHTTLAGYGITDAMPLVCGVAAGTLAMGGPLGSGLVDSPIVSDIAAHGKLWIGYNFVGAGAGPIYNGDLCLNFCPENGYGVAFTWAGTESFRIQSDLSVLINNGNWLEFGELNHYIRNKNSTDLAHSDLEIGSSYGNTVFLSGGGCYMASESLRVGQQYFGLSGAGYGIQAPNVWDSGLLSSVVKTDANGKLVACSNLSDASYQPLLTNPVTGTGTQYYLPVWGAGGVVQGNSLIRQNSGATSIGVNGSPVSGVVLALYAAATGASTPFSCISDVQGRCFSILQQSNTTNGYACQFNVVQAGQTTINNFSSYSNGALGTPAPFLFYTSGLAVSATTVIPPAGTMLQLGAPYSGESIGSVPVARFLGSVQSQTPQTILRLNRPLSYGNYYSASVDFNVYAYAVGTMPRTELDIALKNAGSQVETANLTVLSLRDDGTVYIPALSTAGVLQNAITTGQISSHATGNTLLQRGNSSGQLDDCGSIASLSYLAYSGGVLTLNNTAASSEGIRVNTNGATNGSTSLDARATGPGTTNTAIYADAEGGGTNWGLYVNAGNAQFNGLVGIGGSPSMSAALDIYANVASSNLLYIKNNNTNYGSMITFPAGYIGDWGSAAATWSGSYGNIAPASKTGLVGSSSGLFLTAMGGNIQLATHGMTTVGLEIADGGITMRQQLSLALSIVGGVLQNAVTTGAVSSHTCGNGALQKGNASGQLADCVSGTDYLAGNFGTTGYLPKITTAAGVTTLGNSPIWTDGTSVGIGTTSPGCPLDNNLISYTASITAPANAGTTLVNSMGRFRSNVGVGMDIGAQSVSPFGLWIQCANTTNLSTCYPLLLNPNGGNVGVGTTSPQTTLTVAGSFSTKTPVVSGSNYTVGSPYSISATDFTVIFTNATADQYVTMPNVSTFAGRILCLQAPGAGGFNLIMTNGSLFMPPGGTTPTNIILNTNNYTTCILHSDGTYWRTLSRS